MIPPLLRELEQVFDWVLTASWQAAVLALVILILQRCLRGSLNPRWRYALWLLVIARLLLPVEPESAWSLFQFAPQPSPTLVAPVTTPLFAPAPSLPEAPAQAVPSLPEEHPLSLYSLLAILWLTGVAALAILTWQVNRRFAREVDSSPEIQDAEIRMLFEQAKAELALRQSVRLIENGQVQSPAIMGLFHPTLLLPRDVRQKFTSTELRLIFLHELAHLKRGDVLVQGLIALLQILHWFNPVLWFAFRRMRADREPATDALVLSCAGAEEKERYGLMLIKLLEHFNQRHSLPTLVGILEDKDQFKRRFSLIAKFTRGAYAWSFFAVILIAVIAIVGLTRAGSSPLIPLGVYSLPDSRWSIFFNHDGNAYYYSLGETYTLKYSMNEKSVNLTLHDPSGTDILDYDGKRLIGRNSNKLVGDLTSQYYWVSDLPGPNGTLSAAMAEAARDSKQTQSVDDKHPPAKSKEMVKISLKVVYIDEDDYQAHRSDIDAAVQKGDFDYLSHLGSFKLLSEPVVLTKSGERGVMEAVRVFPYPIAFAKDASGKFTPTDFTRRDLGTRCILWPIVTGNNISIKGNLNITSLEGWIQTEENPHKPIFNVREAPVSESFVSGQTKGFEVPGGAQMDPWMGSPWPSPDASQKTKALRRIFFFLTAAADKGALPKKDAAASPSPAATEIPNTSKADAGTPATDPDSTATPLRKAIDGNQVDKVKFLLDHGAVIGPAEMEEAVMYSAEPAQKQIAKLLWDHGPHYCSALAYAISQGAPVDQLEGMLNKGALADPPEDHTISPLGIAAQKGDLAVAQLLVQHGAEPNPSFPHEEPLRRSAETENLAMTDFLIKNGAKGGADVLQYAIVNPDHRPDADAPQIVALLIRAGATKSLLDYEAAHLLLVAADLGKLNILKQLLDAGLSPRSAGNMTPDSGKTVLEIIRDEVAAGKQDLHPSLDLLEAADKGTPPKPIGSTDAAPKPDMVKISLKVAEIDDNVYNANKDKIDAEAEKGGPEIFKLFNNLKGVSLLSTPSVTTKLGQKATVEITREFPYPTSFDNGHVVPNSLGTPISVPPTPREFTTKDVGVSVEITPSIDDGNSSDHGKIILNGKFSVTDFEGFTKSNLVGTGMPSFSTRESLFIESLDDNQEVSIWIPGARYDEQAIIDQMASGKTLSSSKIGKKRLLLFVSAARVK